MLRIRWTPRDVQHNLDLAARMLLQTILGTPLSDEAWVQAVLPLRMGGLGLPDFNVLPATAFLASCAATYEATFRHRRVHTEQTFCQRFPRMHKDLTEAQTQATNHGCTPPTTDQFLTTTTKHVQRALNQQAAIASRDALLNSLPVDAQAWLRSCAGPGAAAWLLPPRGDPDTMGDVPFTTAVLLRLLEKRKAHMLYCLDLSRTEDGDAGRRHDDIRKHLEEWLRKFTAYPVHHEQVLPELQVPGTEERRMDILAHDHVGNRVLIDVAVTHPVSTNADKLARAALSDGIAGAAEENHKFSKYRNAAGLAPFVLETGGRVSACARALVRRLAPTDPTARSAAIAGLWQTISVCLQTHNAAILHDVEQT